MSVISAAEAKPRQRFVMRFDRRSLEGMLLVAPLSILIILVLLVPLARFMLMSVDNRDFAASLAQTSSALEGWDGKEAPPESAYTALAADLLRAENPARIGARLNYFHSGMNSLVRKAATAIAEEPASFGREEFLEVDDVWGDVETWHAIGLATDRLTAEYYLNAVDLQSAWPDTVEAKPEGRRIYVNLWLRTIIVALVVVAVCTIVGYPIAFFLSQARGFVFLLAMGMVLLPFWTPLLARIASWIVLLESGGVINSVLAALGLIDGDSRPQLLNNLFATTLVMSYVLMPYAILPTYAVMQRVQPSLFQAALTLGATPVRAFFTVYLPQTLPGVFAGAILIFVLSFGFYLTPELVGGPGGALIGNQIAYHFSKSLNWGLAGALSTILLAVITAAALLMRSVAQRRR